MCKLRDDTMSQAGKLTMEKKMEDEGMFNVPKDLSGRAVRGNVRSGCPCEPLGLDGAVCPDPRTGLPLCASADCYDAKPVPAVRGEAVAEGRPLYWAAINCAHLIDDSAVTLYRNRDLPGNALSQLGDRLDVAAASLAAPTPASPDLRSAGPIAVAVRQLTDYCFDASHAAGWWVNPRTGVDSRDNPMCFSQKLMLIVSEVAEAMEGDRKNLQDDKLPHRPMREVELADALIRICDLAGAYGMDLGGAVEEKMAFNKVRPDHQIAVRAGDGGKAY